MKKIAVVTVARSDYRILRPVLFELQRAEGIELQVIAAAAHLSPLFGNTINDIEADGFVVSHPISLTPLSDSPRAQAESLGGGLARFAWAYDHLEPDMIILLGDRAEMHIAAVAAAPFHIPIAHIHGGELTTGALDNNYRHSITQLSHLHFTATQTYANRLMRLGVEPWRVMVSGAPGLDGIKDNLKTPDQLQEEYGVDHIRSCILVTYHPETITDQDPAEQIAPLLQAIENMSTPAIFTMPNADAGSIAIRDAIGKFVDGRPFTWAFENLGNDYPAFMAASHAMVGNSSSGIIEAASFGLPVVNIGDRQGGRTQSGNVIDVKNEERAIYNAIWRATGSQQRDYCKTIENAYGDGQASARIVAKLQSTKITPALLVKQFNDGYSFQGPST